MKKRMLIFLLVTAFFTVSVIMVELSIRSAVLSPFILLDSKKNVGVQKLLTGYSIYQGDYLLDIENTEEDSTNRPLAFHIGPIDYQFIKVNTENIILPAGEELTVMTRRGVEPSFSKEVTIQSSKRKFFFNEYTIRAAKNDGSFSIQLKTEFSKTLTFLIYGCSFLLPFLLALFINKVLPWRNLFTLFVPFILAGILPLILNYHFSMGYALLLTKSYIWSILLCIFLPTFLSVSLTTAIYQWTIKSDEDIEGESEMEESDFLEFSKKEKVVIFVLTIGSLAYFFSFFLFPLSLYVKIVDKWYLFAAWYLSLTLIIMLVYTVIHRFMGNYENVGFTEQFYSLKKTIEAACSINVNLFTKKESENETNAWVYSTPFASKKSINIYMTEGLIKKFTLDEVKAVLFHEIGHIKRKHGRWILFITFGVATLISLLMFFTRKIMLGFGWGQYILIFPVGIIALIGLTEWLPNKISKMFEHQADEFAVRQLGNKELYIQTLMKLERISEKENDEFDFKRKVWKETHPSFQKRINFIKDLE